MQDENGLDALRRARHQESAARPANSRFQPLSSFERRVLFVAAVAMLLLVALHFPFDGYLDQCPFVDPDFACRDGVDAAGVAPTWYWESRGSLVLSLRPFKYFLMWEIVVVIVAALAVLVFGDRWKKRQRSPEIEG